VVLGAAAGFATGPALYQNLSSLFIPDLQAAFGWGRGEIATVAGLGLLAAFAAPVVGRIADRRGVVVSTLILAGGHFVLAALGGAIWQFGLGVALLALAAPGLSTLVFGRLIANRFDRSRGLALGIATTGISLSTLLLPPLFSVVIAEYGWRAGYYLLAALALGVGLPLALVAVRSAGPIVASRPHPDKTDTQEVAEQEPPLSWRDPEFLRIAGAIVFINIGTVGMVTQLALIVGERGIGLATAGLVVSAYGLSQVVGRLGIGVLVDRFPAGRMAALFAGASAIGFTLLAAGVASLPAIIAAVFLAGLMNGAEHDLVPYLVSRLFPLEAFGRVLGRLVAVGILSGGVGIVGFGWLREWTVSYTLPLAVACVAMLLVVALFLLLPARR
jgi:MFS family permease